jgi:uncharacterized membrane protein HdeD (DUF308 family)
MVDHADHRDRIVDRLAQLGRSPGLSFGAGALSIIIGLLVLAWPGATIVVIAWLFAVQLLVAGILQLISAFAEDASAGGRVLRGLLGTLTILVGLLCLRAPLQTALVLGLLIGAMWVVSGVIDVVQAIGGGPAPGRGWRIASGVLLAIGGAIVLVYPGAGLVTLTWLLGIVLVVNGILLVAHGFAARRAASSTVSGTGLVGPTPTPS